MDKKQTWQKKIYNLDKSTKIKLVIGLFGIILVGVIMLKFVEVDDCYIKEYTLLDQTLNFDDKCNTMRCLFIDVVDEDNIKTTLHFDDDTKLLNESFDINVGDKMKIKWCNIKNVGYRVRGVAKS